MIDFGNLIKRLEYMTVYKEIEWEDSLLEHSFHVTHLVYRTAVDIDCNGNRIQIEINETAFLNKPTEVSMKVANLFHVPDDYRLMILDLLDCIDSVGMDTPESDVMEMESRINQWLDGSEEE